MNREDPERIAELLGELPPPPDAWVKAAQELPAARDSIDRIVAAAAVDRAYRDAVLADLNAALREAGCDEDPRLVEALRERLDAL